MPTERVYSAGDRVVFLGRGNANGVAGLQNYGNAHYTERWLRDLPFAIAEGIVTEVFSRGNGPEDKKAYGGNHNVVYVKFQNSPDEFGGHIDYRLSQRYLRAVSDPVELGMATLNLPEEQKVWMRSLIYPLVVSSQGYTKLLTDLLRLARPDADIAEARQADVEEIIRKCEQYGLPWVPIDRKYLTTRWSVHDKLEEEQPMKKPMNARLPRFEAVQAAAQGWGEPIAYHNLIGDQEPAQQEQQLHFEPPEPEDNHHEDDDE